MSPRAALRALLPFALYAVSREWDRAVGLILRSSLDLPDIASQVLAVVSAREVGVDAAVAILAGLGLWTLLAAIPARGASLGERFDQTSTTFAPLLIRPALSVLALWSLVWRPTYPYGFTLPVALTQDWSPAVDAAALATIVCLRARTLRFPAPKARGVAFVAFLLYALITPDWARRWEGHPGNEPKYLRMAVTLGHSLSLDVEGIDDPMESLEPRPLPAALSHASAVVVGESVRMGEALLHGPSAVGEGAIRASRIARQTIRGKEGGIFHVLAPGPSVFLAPALRLDRELNRTLGTPGRVVIAVLCWNALAAALVAALFLLVRDATGRPGLAAVLAGAFALTPPFVFYAYEFYPEMPGALVIAIALRLILFVPRWRMRHLLGLGAALAVLPWLHQKFLPIWAVLLLMALIKAVDEMVPARELLALVVPQAATIYLTALYNFAITGSVRPDAMYIAWGPRGITAAHLGQGFFGLMLDARYGILPMAPIYLLAAAGLAMRGSGAARLRLALPAAFSYYLTVAAADDWNGAVSNIGRYMMPIAPYLVVLIGVLLERLEARRGALALPAIAFAWTALIARQLWLDPLAANDSAVLLQKSTFADGAVYLPNLFIHSFADGAPGLYARIGTWLLLAVAAAVYCYRVDRGPGGVRPTRALAAVVVVALGAGWLLERWPSDYRGPRFHDRLDAGYGVSVFVSGAATAEAGYALAHRGRVDLLIRSRAPMEAIDMDVSGRGTVHAPGWPPLIVPTAGLRLRVPLDAPRLLVGRRGAREALTRQRIGVDSSEGIALRFAVSAPPRQETGEPPTGPSR